MSIHIIPKPEICLESITIVGKKYQQQQQRTMSILCLWEIDRDKFLLFIVVKVRRGYGQTMDGA